MALYYSPIISQANAASGFDCSHVFHFSGRYGISSDPISFATIGSADTGMVYDADLSYQFIAAVGAVVQLGLAFICSMI